MNLHICEKTKKRGGGHMQTKQPPVAAPLLQSLCVRVCTCRLQPALFFFVLFIYDKLCNGQPHRFKMKEINIA